MATKKQKEWWYVLVLTNEGPKFVTDVKYEGRTAQWDKLAKPYLLDREGAKQLALGLTWNGNVAFAVCQSFELDQQPYRYQLGHFEWKYDNTEQDNEAK